MSENIQNGADVSGLHDKDEMFNVLKANIEKIDFIVEKLYDRGRQERQIK